MALCFQQIRKKRPAEGVLRVLMAYRLILIQKNRLRVMKRAFPSESYIYK
jgi:hypothetical protein